MLTIAESNNFFVFIELLSTLYIVPFSINRGSGKLCLFKGYKLVIWWIIYFVFLLLYVYEITVFSLTALVKSEELNLYHLTIQYSSVLVPALFHPIVMNIYMTNAHGLIVVFNEMYRNPREYLIRKKRPLKELCVEDLMTTGLPVVVGGAWMMLMGLVAMEPSMFHLLINSRPVRHWRESIVALIIFTMIEAYCIALWMLNVAFLCGVNSQVQAKVAAELIHWHSKLTETGRTNWVMAMRIRKSLSAAKCMQLLVQAFNGINAWCLEVVKLVCMSVAIIDGYVAIRFGAGDYVVAGLNGLIHIAAFVVYWGMFQRGHWVSRHQRRLKRELIAAAGRYVRNPEERESLLKSAASLRCPGIRVGAFHEMERSSVPVFVDFVENQLINLLVAF